MSSATSVLRRYTPPTCTLEIAANNSPLSRWMGQSALKNVRFKLSFDDPRVSEDRWVAVRGDRNQLQALCDAVTSYVQRFLHQSSNFITQRESSSNGAVAAPQSFVGPTGQPFEAQSNPAGIYLEPRGMLSHELHLGSLATDESGSTIQLSAVQLADLATALDEYAADVTAIPTLNRPSWASTSPAWGKIAAVSLVAIGLTTTAVRLLDRQPDPQTASSQGASSADQRLAIEPLPSSPQPSSSLTLPSLPTTTVPLPSLENSSPSAPTAPENLPKFKVEQKAPEGAQSGIQLPVREAPEGSVQVAPIPDQTAAGAQAPQVVAKAPPAARSTAKDPDGDPLPLGSEPSNSSAASIQGAGAANDRPQLPSVRDAARQASPETSKTQVDELKTYFTSRWQAPKELPDDIQFVLTLAPDGSLRAVEPVGPNATLYRDRASIPALGEVIATPNPNGQETKVRLLLKTNGTVQALAE